jgi:Flp pilus assembly protein TadD
MMSRSTKFWISMAAFQIVFGLAVFAVTRQYYVAGADSRSITRDILNESTSSWPDELTAADLTAFDSLLSSQSSLADPVEVSRQADESFANREYARAAKLYERLLAFDSNNMDTYNNLGITLHYLGQSSEALRTLNEGVARDPTHQRIWLTLGFVNAQLGNTSQARIALTNAIQIGADDDVGQSAARMLVDLP